MVALVLDDLVGFPAGLSPTSFHLSPSSFHLSPRLGACGRVPGRLVSHFFSFVSQAGCLWSGSRPACLPLLFICLPVLFIPKQYTVRGSQRFKEWSPWCWMVWSGSRPACLPLPFMCLPVLFICLPSFVSQAGCLWSGSRLACLPLPFICLPLLFICLPVLFICLPG